MGRKEARRDRWDRYRPDIVSRLPSLRLCLTPLVLGAGRAGRAGLGTGHWAVGVVCVRDCVPYPCSLCSLSFPPSRAGLRCLLPTECHMMATNAREPDHVKDEGVVRARVSERMVWDNIAGL